MILNREEVNALYVDRILDDLGADHLYELARRFMDAEAEKLSDSSLLYAIDTFYPDLRDDVEFAEPERKLPTYLEMWVQKFNE